MHIPPFDNKNKPIVDIEDSRVPLNYFNIVKLNKDQSFEYQTPGYETCIVPATGKINVEIEGIKVESLGTLEQLMCGMENQKVFMFHLIQKLNLHL